MHVGERQSLGVSVADVTFRLTVMERAGTWELLCHSPLGEDRVSIPPPFTAAEIDRARLELERSILRSSSPVVSRHSSSPERTARAFGRTLTDVLMSGEIRVIFERCRDAAREQGADLTVRITPDGPAVGRLPWEFALDPYTDDDYLALRMPVARVPFMSRPMPPLRITPPLRILGVLSRPHDRPALEVDEERRRISASLAEGSGELFDVHWLPGDRWTDLVQALESEPWHVLHFIGHGGFDEENDSGYLELSNDDGSAKQAWAGEFGRTLRRNHHLRLVVLNACESATVGAGGMFSSTAAKIMREGVPAVVAMQFEITDPAALNFATAFYAQIAHGRPVDQAVRHAREAVKFEHNSLEWATPVLLLGSEETRIFQVPETARPGDARPDDGRPEATRPEATRPPTPPDAEPPIAPVPAASTPAPQASATTPTAPPTAPPAGPAVEPATRGGAPPSASAPSAAPPAPPTPAPAAPPTAGGSRPEASERGPVTAAPVWLTGRRLAPSFGRSLHLAVGPRDLVAVAGADGQVRVWSIPRGRQVAQCSLPPQMHPQRVAWTPWPRNLATVDEQAVVAVWDLETEVAGRVIRPACPTVHDLAFSQDGRWLALSGSDGVLRVFGVDGQEVRTVPVLDRDGRAVTLGPIAFAPDGRGLLASADDGTVRQFNVRGSQVMEWRHPQRIAALAVTAARVATSMVDGRFRLWTWDGTVVARADRPAPITRLAFSPSGLLLVGTATDGALTVWSADGRVLAEGDLGGPPVGLGVTDEQVVTGTEDGLVQSWTLDPVLRPEAT